MWHWCMVWLNQIQIYTRHTHKYHPSHSGFILVQTLQGRRWNWSTLVGWCGLSANQGWGFRCSQMASQAIGHVFFRNVQSSFSFRDLFFTITLHLSSLTSPSSAFSFFYQRAHQTPTSVFQRTCSFQAESKYSRQVPVFAQVLEVI